MGGGALILAGYLGNDIVVGLLIGCVTFSMGMVLMIPSASLISKSQKSTGDRTREILHNVKLALSNGRTWKGLLFAILGGAAFKSLEVVIGPYLIDRDFTKTQVGYMTAGPMIGSMVVGALVGGRLADVFRRRRLVAGALVFIAASIAGLAGWDLVTHGQPGNAIIGFLCVTAFGIGWFTAASYALFMDLTTPLIAATQFSAFMGATNACESWSVYTIGRLIDGWGYPLAFLCMCAASLLALPILLSLDLPGEQDASQTAGKHAPE
jgi:MFS family permease